MAMGRRKGRERQRDLWVAVAELPKSGGHPFYQRLSELLDEHEFDAFVEGECEKFYAPSLGRPSLTPGIYFRSLLIGYFEGIDSERGLAWRIADSLSLRRFLAIEFDEDAPVHSTISRTRRLIDIETHRAVFSWALKLLAREGILAGGTIGVDATTLEANAAMRSLVRRDTGEGYEEYLGRLAEESGIETPTREQLAKIDKKRKNKASNKDWKHPHDPDAKVTKMKDGCTHLAHKVEHAVDLETGAVVAVTLQAADEGDTTTIEETLVEAAEQLEAAAEEARETVEQLSEVVTDKGYHSNGVLTDLAELDVRSYVSEPQRGRRKWGGRTRQRDALYGNRRRIKGQRGKLLMKLRAEKVERSFAHCYETGGMRRVHLKGRGNVLKRLLIQVGAFNLSVAMRGKLGAGTPRGLADARKRAKTALERLAAASWAALGRLCEALGEVFGRLRAKVQDSAGAPVAAPHLLAA